MKLPISAIKALKHYCEKTQCRRCPFGYEDTEKFVECELIGDAPCEWEIPKEKTDEAD